MRNNLIKELVKIYNKIRVQQKKISDPNFNAFLSFEQEQSLDNINSKEKLEYLKMLDLSKQGFINPERKQFFKMEEKLYNLMDIDQDIKMIGQVSVSQKGELKKSVFVGFNTKTNKMYLSNSHIKEIPIWKKPVTEDVKAIFSAINPGVDQNQDNTLSFQNDFFTSDVEGLDNSVRENLEKEFHKVADIAFRSNKYIEDSYPTLPNDFAKTVNKYKDVNFKVPSSLFPNLKTNSEFIVAKLINQDDTKFLFKPLIKNGKQERITASREGVENMISNRNVELIGKLNNKIAIGIDKKTGSTKIGIKEPNRGYQWKLHDQTDYRINLNNQEKEVVNKIVETKDFLIEKDKVIIKNEKDLKETLIVKKHASKPGLYYMETYKNSKPYSLSNFQKLNSQKAIALATKYKSNTAIKSFKSLAEKEGVVEKKSGKEIWNNITKAASYAAHR